LILINDFNIVLLCNANFASTTLVCLWGVTSRDHHRPNTWLCHVVFSCTLYDCCIAQCFFRGVPFGQYCFFQAPLDCNHEHNN